ncbi:UNVERIFIED_CONTAM: hypothetical protein FKN15_010204 [Acipenser sinensis]
MVVTMQLSLETCLAKFEEMECFKMATSLDLHFKLDWCKDEGVHSMREPLTNKVTSLLPRVADMATSPPPKTRIKLFSYMTNRSTETCSSISTTDAASEISDYLSQPCLPEDCDPLAYWKGKQIEFPHLAQLACKHLAIPASTAPVERLFSVTGKVFRPER